jgi:hypothetical protein
MDFELHKYPGLLEFCQQLYDDRYRSPYLIACMIDTYEEMLEENCGERKEVLQKAVSVRYYIQSMLSTKILVGRCLTKYQLDSVPLNVSWKSDIYMFQ